MGITPEQYKKMMRFLDAEMEPDEMDDFEKEMAANPEMRSQLDFEQSVRDGFALRGINSLPDTVPANGNAEARVKPGKVKAMRKWLAISAAAVIIILTLFAILWQKPGKTPDVAKGKDIDTAQEKNNQPQVTVTNPAKDSAGAIDLALLFKQYFKKDALPEQYPLFLAEALMDYESGKYTTLQQLNLNDLPQTRSSNETNSKENILKWGHYYKGLAFLQTNNTRNAIIHLDWVIKNQQDKTLKAKAQWYLALAYLKENNGVKAAKLCRSIVSNKENHLLIKNAEKILDALGK